MRRSKGRTDSPDVTNVNHNAELGEATAQGQDESLQSSSSQRDKKHEPEIKKQVTITVQPGVKPKPTVKKKRSTPSADLVSCCCVQMGCSVVVLLQRDGHLMLLFWSIATFLWLENVF